MKFYELTYLISPELSEEEANSFQKKITSFIQEEGGVLVETSTDSGGLEKRNLAYPIKKRSQAYLAWINFKLNPEIISNLEKKLKSENQILRYLIVIKKVPKIVPKRVRKLKEVFPKKPVIRIPEKKVELKEIEKKLEEILKE